MTTIEILGIYRPRITPEIFYLQNETYDDEVETKRHFSGLVLVEVRIDQIDERFDFGDFHQTDFAGKSFDQVAYDEALLNDEGTKVLTRGLLKLSGSGPFRCTFFLHYYQPDRPLTWSYGHAICPPVQEIPERLHRAVPYCPI
jgi:hypothetical protein